MTFAEKVRAVAADRNLSLRELAERAGLAYDTLAGYLARGSTHTPSVLKGIALARALEVPTDWLFNDAEGLPPPPRLETPPFAIKPWPPLITWEFVQHAILARFMEMYKIALPISPKILAVVFSELGIQDEQLAALGMSGQAPRRAEQPLDPAADQTPDAKNAGAFKPEKDSDGARPNEPQ